MSWKDAVYATVKTAFDDTATSFELERAVAPMQDPPPSGALVLTDSFNVGQKTKFEVITYTSLTLYSSKAVIGGVTRGASAESWSVGDLCFQDIPASALINYDTAYSHSQDDDKHLPAGGSSGQLLSKTNTGSTWTTSTAYTHPTTAGNKHLPAGGESGDFVRWNADGEGAWGEIDEDDLPSTMMTFDAVSTAINNHETTTNRHSISAIAGLQTALDAKVATADIKNNLTSTDTNKPLSAAQGKALQDGKVAIAAIADSLTSTATNEPLSANQGRVLKGLIDAINTLLISDESTLDTVQEIVDFIELNRSTLDSLGISNIAGLQNALNDKLNTSAVSTFGASLIDDVDAATARATLGVDPAGTINYSLPASVVHDDEPGVLHATDALRISGHTVSLYKGDGTSESVIIPDNNTTYSTATSSTDGLVKIGYTESGKNYPVELSSGKMYVNVPWTDNNTTYSVGDGGLTQKNFTTTLKSKLDGIESNADVTDTNNVVAALTEGTNIAIASDGTVSATDTNTTYSVGDGGLTEKNFTAALKTKVDGMDTSATPTLTVSGSTVTISNYSSYTEPFVSVRGHGFTPSYTQAAGVLTFSGLAFGDATIGLAVAEQDKIQSKWAGGNLLGSFRYYRIQGLTLVGSSGTYLREFTFYSAAGQSGTAYPSTMTADNAPTPYVVTSSYYYSSSYEDYKAFDGSYNGWWTLGHTASQVATDWLQIDMGPTPPSIQSAKIDFNPSYYSSTLTLVGSNTGAFSGEEVTVFTQTGMSGGVVNIG